MGFIFVFDLDLTLAGEYIKPPYKNIDLNERLVRDQLERIHKGRSSRTTDAVFLYTNNGDEAYVKAVQAKIATMIDGFSFDDVMTRNDKRRYDYSYENSAANNKAIQDVITMMKGLKARRPTLDMNNIQGRTIFFDDNPYHELVGQMRTPKNAEEGTFLPRTFIWIQPPYTSSVKDADLTDYSLLDEIFSQTLALAPRITNNALNTILVGGRKTRRGKRRSGNKKWATRRLRKPGPKRSQNAL